jgi:integrase
MNPAPGPLTAELAIHWACLPKAAAGSTFGNCSQESEAILAVADDTWTGQRDHLCITTTSPYMRLSKAFDKRKQRRVPLWPQTLKPNGSCADGLKTTTGPRAPLLPNRFGQRLTRAGAAYQLQQLVKRASTQMPTLKKRPISPHSFRHASAMALLEAQVPTEVIALYLGHESPQTTHLDKPQ